MASIYGLDLRSLAFFRIGLAIVLIFDLCFRLRDFKAFYTDFGIFPKDRMLHWGPLSLHVLTGSVLGQSILFGAALLFALLLLLGWYTRLASFVSWALLLSLHQGNLDLVECSDNLLLHLVFWSIFLPVGETFSVDSTFRGDLKMNRGHRTTVSSAAVVGLQVEIVSMYFCAGLLKLTDPPWQEGLGLIYSFSIEQWVTSVGKLMQNYPELLRFASKPVAWVETLGSLLIFIPWRNAAFRGLAILLFSGFHIASMIFFAVGSFTAFGLIAWIAIIPGKFWNYLPFNFQKYRNGFGEKRTTQRHKLSNVNLFQGRDFASIVSSVLCIAVTIFSTFENLGNLPYSVGRLPDSIRKIGHDLGFYQEWNLFNSKDFVSSGWFVIPGTLQNGTRVDLFSGKMGISFEKPQMVSSTFLNDRWLFFFDLLQRYRDEALLELYSDFMCRFWNQGHPESNLENLKIIFLQDKAKETLKVASCI